MEFYERVSGARFHSAFIRPGGIAQDINDRLLNDIFLFCEQFYFRVDELQDVLNSNRIWKDRLVNVGIVNKQDAFSYAFSGVMLRSSGFF